MSFTSYFLNIYTEVGLASLFATGAFAWWKGAAPERLGTLVFGLGTVAACIWRAMNGEHAAVMPLFAVDLMMALGFLYIAIRYSSLWLGAAMMLLAASFALHATGLSDPARPRWHGMIIYLLANNILSYLTLAALAGGTVATIMKRRQAVRRKAEAEAKRASRPRSLVSEFIAQQPPHADMPSATPRAATR
jgi:hypothetical protein